MRLLTAQAAKVATAARALATQCDHLALTCLQREADLELKPGLVCPSSRGSHADMDWLTFERSVKSLKGYFANCVLLGFGQQPLRELQKAGLQAEQAMFKATQGINTHKGAIFTLGLLAAAVGWQFITQGRISPYNLGQQVAQAWGADIAKDAQRLASDVPTHGEDARLQGIPGAREQAYKGFTHVFEYTLPALTQTMQQGHDAQRAGIHALLATMATLPDTNIVHRGGLDGLVWAQQASAKTLNELDRISPNSHDWRAPLVALGKQFEQRWLSPGGSADLLSAAWFVYELELLKKQGLALPNTAFVGPNASILQPAVLNHTLQQP